MRIPEKRIIELKKLIQKEKMITVDRISKLFDISPITVRRDLERLHNEGFLNKVHGGAVYRDMLEPEPVFNEQVRLHRDEKVRIAKEAAKRINDGDAIIIESGSTCLGLIKYLVDKKNLKVTTAGIPVSIELWKLSSIKKDIEVSVCGGVIRTGSSIYVGPHAVSYFEKINVDKAFISAVAVSMDKGISTATQFDAELIKAMTRSAREIILLCDSSKFGNYSYINIMPISKLDEIITDKNIDSKIVKEINKLGVKITLV